MSSDIEQRKFWSSEFGDNYIDRNVSLKEVNEFYLEQTGFTQEQIFNEFFSGINKDSKILEIGCNVGLKLSILKKMGFQNLFGIEINKKAFEKAKLDNPGISFINTSIEEFDPKEERFDLVYTSGLLIHINPSVLQKVLEKIINLTEKYIFGFEYYSDNLTEINYRGHSNVCWKQNFPLLFKNIFPSLETIKERKIYYKNQDLCDIAYLLQKPKT